MEMKWEMFCDPAYYDMWTVRQVDGKDFNNVFHFIHRTEAERLLKYLNSLENKDD